MASLGLNDGPLSNTYTGDFSLGNMTWWFWIKAGMGFTFGAGIVWVSGVLLWFVLVYNLPSLAVLRWLTRF